MLFTPQELQELTWLQELMSRRVVEFAEAGFTREDFKHILRRHPMLVYLSFRQNVLPKLLLLRGLGYQAGKDPLTEGEIRRIVMSFPSAFCLSLANIESKLKYLVIDLQREGCEILACPLYLSLSMKGRIVPRVKYLQARGVNQRDYTLRHIFAGNDAAFCKTVGVDMTDYMAFKDSRNSS